MSRWLSCGYILPADCAYQQNLVIMVDNENDSPVFYEIRHTFLKNDNNKDCVLSCRLSRIPSFNVHYRAFEVSHLFVDKLISLNEIYFNRSENFHTLHDGTLMVEL